MTGETVVLAVLATATAVNTYYDRKAKKEAAVKVEEVKQVLETTNSVADKKLNMLQTTADDTHKLVNSKMAVQLMISATSARALSDLTKKKEHLKLAVVAERALEEHLKQQAEVDEAIRLRILGGL